MNTFSIYQLKGGEETWPIRFEAYDRLIAMGKKPEAKNYNLVYNDILTDDMTLDGLFYMFNEERPSDFRGHSLSVSDVIVLRKDGNVTANYIDAPFGFRELADFNPSEVD